MLQQTFDEGEETGSLDGSDTDSLEDCFSQYVLLYINHIIPNYHLQPNMCPLLVKNNKLCKSRYISVSRSINPTLFEFHFCFFTYNGILVLTYFNFNLRTGTLKCFCLIKNFLNAEIHSLCAIRGHISH